MKSVLGKTRRTDVTFRKDGRVDISARIARLLDLRVGDVMDVAIGGGEVVLYRRLKAEDAWGRHEACCYCANNKGWSMRFHSKRLVTAVLAMVGETDKAECPAGEMMEVDGRQGVVVLIRLARTS